VKLLPDRVKRDLEYCLLSEERNPVQRKPQQVLLICTFGGPPDQRGSRAAGSAGALPTTMPQTFSLIIMEATFLYVQLRGEMNTHNININNNNNNNNPNTTSFMGSRWLVRQALYLKSLVLRPFLLCLLL
jgi:hypothetical protein